MKDELQFEEISVSAVAKWLTQGLKESLTRNGEESLLGRMVATHKPGGIPFMGHGLHFNHAEVEYWFEDLFKANVVAANALRTWAEFEAGEIEMLARSLEVAGCDGSFWVIARRTTKHDQHELARELRLSPAGEDRKPNDVDDQLWLEVWRSKPTGRVEMPECVTRIVLVDASAPDELAAEYGSAG